MEIDIIYIINDWLSIFLSNIYQIGSEILKEITHIPPEKWIPPKKTPWEPVLLLEVPLYYPVIFIIIFQILVKEIPKLKEITKEVKGPIIITMLKLVGTVWVETKKNIGFVKKLNPYYTYNYRGARGLLIRKWTTAQLSSYRHRILDWSMKKDWGWEAQKALIITNTVISVIGFILIEEYKIMTWRHYFKWMRRIIVEYFYFKLLLDIWIFVPVTAKIFSETFMCRFRYTEDLYFRQKYLALLQDIQNGYTDKYDEILFESDYHPYGYTDKYDEIYLENEILYSEYVNKNK
jgi:hypothetical protein